MFVYRVPALTTFFCLLLLKYGDCLQLRILIHGTLDQEKIKTAQTTGTAYSTLYDTICSEMIQPHPWLEDCELFKYQFSSTTPINTTVLVNSKTSTEADRSLEDVKSVEMKLFLINQKLRQDIKGVNTAVDLHRSESGMLPNLVRLSNRRVQFKTDTVTYHKMDTIDGTPLTIESFSSMKDRIQSCLWTTLKTQLGTEGTIIAISSKSVMRARDQTIVKYTHHVLHVVESEEMTFPEQWKLALQRVVDSMEMDGAKDKNFQLPVLVDRNDPGVLKTEFDILFPNYDQQACYAPSELEACGLLTQLVEPLHMGYYECYASKRKLLPSGELYLRVRGFLPKSVMFKPELKLYSDLNFVELMKSIRNDLTFSIYSHGDIPTYEYYSDPDDETHFIIKMWTFAETRPSIDRPTVDALNSNPGKEISKSVFCDRINTRLNIPRQRIKCFWVHYVVIEDRLAMQALVRIQKDTPYWDQENPWTVPLRIARKLQDMSNKMIHVEWRRQEKYSLETDVNPSSCT